MSEIKSEADKIIDLVINTDKHKNSDHITDNTRSLESYSLDALCKHYGINNTDAHRALGDCFATLELLKKIRDMKPTELRIGNYVFGMTDTYVDREDKIDVNVFKVALLAEDVIKLDIGFGALESYEQKPIISRRLNELKPIPLTEQWLLKFGFENVENESIEFILELEEKFLLSIIIEDLTWAIGYGFDWSRTFNIKYVHQLQNLYFLLTSEELKLKQ